MTGADLVAEAVAELYSADPEEFVRRRQELAGAARSAGQAAAARQIAALRKPTRAAWMINQLARSDPGPVAGLTGLGEQLRAAERSGDGTRLRELARDRRQLIASLVRRALEVSGQPSAPAVLREEITVTLAAALADPEIAEEIQRGTLHRAEQRAGFGPAEAPALSVVPPPPGSTRPGQAREPRAREDKARGKDPKASGGPAQAAPARARARARPAQREAAVAERRGARAQSAQPGPAAAGRRAGREARAQQAAAEAKAVQERRLAEVRAQAERALADAEQAVTAAARDQQEFQSVISRLERELADARRRLRMAAAETRRTGAARDRARQALDRLPADHAPRR